MSLSLGSLTATATSRLKSTVVGSVPTIDNKKITNIADIKKAGSRLKASAKSLPERCVKSKVGTMGSGGSGTKWKLSTKLPCEPLVDKPAVKKILETNKGFEDIKKIPDKKVVDAIISNATDKLNSTSIPAIGRTSLNKLNESKCNPFSGLEFPDLNLPNIHLPHLGLNSLLHDVANGANGIFNTIAGGIGDAFSGLVTCGEPSDATNKSIGLASMSSNIKTSSGILNGLSKSGKLDLGLTNGIGSDDKLGSLVNDTVAVTPTSKLNIESVADITETESVFSKLTNKHSFKDIGSNASILETARTASRAKTDINDTGINSFSKVSVFSKFNKEKMKLVA